MNSNSAHIAALLEKYWEGETTLEEERTLKAYFAGNPLPSQFNREAALFKALAQEKTVELEAPARVVALKPQTYAWSRWAAAASVAILLAACAWWVLRPSAGDPVSAPVAASRVQVLPENKTPAVAEEKPAPVLAMNQAPKKSTARPHPKAPAKVEAPGTIEDPEQAIAEIKAALALVSSKLNKGKKEASKGLDRVDEVDKIFKKKDS